MLRFTIFSNPPQLLSFNSKHDPQEHILTVNTQMEIVGASESLKCKCLVGTLKEASLRWYMGLPKHLVTSYQDLAKKLICQFFASKH